MHLVPAAIDAYSKLNVKHEPLRLITPQFEAPLPSLQPAVSLFKLSSYNIISCTSIVLIECCYCF